MTDNTTYKSGNKKKKRMPLIGRILIVVVIAIAIVIAALFIAVWFTDFDTIGELLSFIKANVSNLPAK